MFGSGASILIASLELDTGVWHRRLGHMSEKGMKLMLSKDTGVEIYKLRFLWRLRLREAGKSQFLKGEKDSEGTKVGVSYTDVWGKASILSLSGSLYFVTFIDDSNRKVWVYFLKQKLDVFDMFKKWLAQDENETGRKINCLKSDNRGEYCDACSKSSVWVGESVEWTRFRETLTEWSGGAHE